MTTRDKGITSSITPIALNVRDYPYLAKADGVTDATSAIQAALTAAGVQVQNTINGYGTLVTAKVFVPSGVYLISSTLTVPEGVTLEGASRGSSVLKYSGTANAVQGGDLTTINTTAYKSNIVIKDLCIYPTTSNVGSIGVKMINCIRNCGVINCMIYGFGINISLSNNASWAVAIEGNYLHNALLNNINAQACNTLRIVWNRCETAGQDNIVIDGGTNSNQPLDILIHQCIIQGAQFHGVKLVDCFQVTITDCDMEGNNLAVGGAYSDVYVVQGAQARTCQQLKIEGGFYSAGTSPNVTHRVAQINNTQVAIIRGILTSGGTNNYDRGILLASTVALAWIDSCILGGCTNPVDFTLNATKLFWRNESGDIVIGDSKMAAALLDVQQSRANANLVNLYNTSNTAGSVTAQIRGGTTDDTTYLVYGLDSTGANVARLTSAGKLIAKKIMPGTDAGALQTANGIYMGTGVPNNANGANGDFYIRTDGTAGSMLYQRRAGAWVASTA
jgi:hypothetical protein